MNDIFIARRSEIEAEAKKRDTTPEALVGELEQLVNKHPELPHTMRAIPKTMRSQFDPVA